MDGTCAQAGIIKSDFFCREFFEEGHYVMVNRCHSHIMYLIERCFENMSKLTSHALKFIFLFLLHTIHLSLQFEIVFLGTNFLFQM